MLVRLCQNRNCLKELKEGNKVYTELYYGSVFCSANCLLEWSKGENRWETTQLYREDFEGESSLQVDYQNGTELETYEILNILSEENKL